MDIGLITYFFNVSLAYVIFEFGRKLYDFYRKFYCSHDNELQNIDFNEDLLGKPYI